MSPLANGGTLWRLRVDSPGAVFLSFKFSSFLLPVDAELHFLSVHQTYADGPYTHRHNKASGRFGSPMIPGDAAIIELYLPPGGQEAKLVVESVSHGFRNAMGMEAIPYRDGGTKDSGQHVSPPLPPPGDFSCQRDINCPEGAPYQDEKRAVAEGYDGTYICSGQLINNTRHDNRYLYITADHCEWWQDPDAMSYYWNYENSGCGTNDYPPFTFSTGSTSLYHSPTPATDVNLLELNGTDFETIYDVYFMGWNRGASAPLNGAMISFPDDKPKQIVIDDDLIVDCTPSGCAQGYGPNYWRIEDWEVGVDEGGSSGGGLMDQDHLIVGVLTGGVGTHCNNFEWDEFSKLSADWVSLQPFLDPDNTGAVSLPGRDGAQMPDAVPTVSSWGIAVMTLLVLVGGTVLLVPFPERYRRLS